MMYEDVNTTWKIVEDGFEVAQCLTNETLFALGNGYLGWRGNFEEGLPGYSVDGNYVNGFYESGPITYGEKFVGYPEKKQTMVNLANGKVIELLVDGEAFNLLTGEVLAHRRVLNMQTGVLARMTTWQSPNGRKIQVTSERLIAQTRAQVAVIRYMVTPLNFTGKVQLFSGIEGAVTAKEGGGEHDPRLGTGFEEEVWQTKTAVSTPNSAILIQQTAHTQLAVACGVRHLLESDTDYEVGVVQRGLRLGTVFTVDAIEGQPVTLTKFVVYETSLQLEVVQLQSVVEALLADVAIMGFAALCEEQAAYLTAFWEKTDVEIEGDDELQRGIRFNLFHLLQSTGRNGRSNIAAKGLTGEGYEGHYFWDTEIYVLPFFLYNNPDISRQLLLYRYHTLDQARARARQMAHPQGALYPWRTINGEECSPFYPSGTAQYHINADIAFALWRYYDATKDVDFMKQYGVEMLCETARLWLDVGHFSAVHEGKFCINGVTGPDEYTTVVNNNAYTNLMARHNLRFAVMMVHWLRKVDRDVYEALVTKIALDVEEVALWHGAAEQMFIPYDEALAIIPQDDSFLQKEVWDFANTPPDHYPLLLHYHPLILTRYQVCKQADLLLAHFLLHDAYDVAQKARDYEFYEPLTTHDSSLSTSVFSILAAELGDGEKAYRYFAETALMDLANKKGNTKDGIHAANMAGAWQAIVFGFAGMRAKVSLSFKPILPDGWQAYAFKVQYRGRTLSVRVTGAATTFTLLEGETMSLVCDRQPVTLAVGESQAVPRG